jgi:hypothetical protein
VTFRSSTAVACSGSAAKAGALDPPGLGTEGRERATLFKATESGVVAYFEFSAPMFYFVMFQGCSCYFASAASSSHPQVSQIEVLSLRLTC